MKDKCLHLDRGNCKTPKNLLKLPRMRQLTFTGSETKLITGFLMAK